MHRRSLPIPTIVPALATLHFIVLLGVNLFTGDPYAPHYWMLISIKFAAAVVSLFVTCYLFARSSARPKRSHYRDT